MTSRTEREAAGRIAGPHTRPEIGRGSTGQARIGAVVPIRTAAIGLSIAKSLMDIVHRATAPKPENRYGSVSELERAVLAFARGRMDPPSPPPMPA